MANEAEKYHWNDEAFARTWPKSEELTDRVTPALLEALALERGEKVLDIGCGGGKTTLAAAHAVGTDGAVIGIDVSRPILELAERRATEAGTANATFVLGDAQIDRMGDGGYDVAFSQFGVMFFDDPTAAFTNIGSHLRPGGRLVFACWQTMERNPWFPGPALAPYVPPTPPPVEGKIPVGPFALGDPVLLQEILIAAGLVDIDVRPQEVVAETSPEADIDEELLVFVFGVAPENTDGARIALKRHRAQFGDPDGPLRFALAFHIVSARRPNS